MDSRYKSSEFSIFVPRAPGKSRVGLVEEGRVPKKNNLIRMSWGVSLNRFWFGLVRVIGGPSVEIIRPEWTPSGWLRYI